MKYASFTMEELDKVEEGANFEHVVCICDLGQNYLDNYCVHPQPYHTFVEAVQAMKKEYGWPEESRFIPVGPHFVLCYYGNNFEKNENPSFILQRVNVN